MTLVLAAAVKSISSVVDASRHNEVIDLRQIQMCLPHKIINESVVTQSGRIRSDENRTYDIQNSISGSEGFTLT